MRITRRQILGSTAAVTLAGAAVGVGAWLTNSGPVASAQTSAPSEKDLLVPGPLGEQTQGKPDAPVTLIEYASVTCSHCADFYANVYPTLKSRYIDTGKLRFIFREFARDSFDLAGFMLARCAGPDKFFPFVDTLFERQNEWAFGKDPQAALLAIAKQAGFTQASFEACLANQKVDEGVRWVRNRAVEKFGVSGTPTLFINAKLFRGAPTADAVGKQIEAYLKS